MTDQTYPRVLYGGAEDDTAETCTVPDAAAEAVALKAGWRTKRIPAGVVADVVRAVTHAVSGHPAKKGGKS